MSRAIFPLLLGAAALGALALAMGGDDEPEAKAYPGVPQAFTDEMVRLATAAGKACPNNIVLLNALNEAARLAADGKHDAALVLFRDAVKEACPEADI